MTNLDLVTGLLAICAIVYAIIGMKTLRDDPLRPPEIRPAPLDEASRFQTIGELLYSQKRFGDALRYYRKSSKWFNTFVPQSDRHQASMHYEIALLAQDLRRPIIALRHYYMALAVYKEHGDLRGEAHVYHQLGVLAQNRKSSEEAESLYAAALETFARMHDKTAAKTLHQLGVLEHERGNRPQARKYYSRALQTFRDYDDEGASGPTLHQLGLMATEQRQPGTAEQYHLEALAIFGRMNEISASDRCTQAASYRQMAAIRESQGRLDEAVDYCKEALEIFEGDRDVKNFAFCSRELSRLAMASGQPNLADRQRRSSSYLLARLRLSHVSGSTSDVERGDNRPTRWFDRDF
jgi:tetratricopeptide (TPR) repeat protein